MRVFRRGSIFLLTSVLASFVVIGGERPDSADAWNGLMLDESTVEDAVAALGRPQKDKEDQKLTTTISNWLDREARFRKLEYKKVAGVDHANFYFLDDHLKVIEIDLKHPFVAAELPLYYDLRYFFKDDSGILRPDPFDSGLEGYRRGEFPSTFHVIGVGDSSFLVAFIAHQGVSRMLYEQTGVRSDVPGSVQVIQLISRLLQGSDVPDRLGR